MNGYSVVEVGGAYAHHFYKFIDFLELKTLFITDLDSVKKTKGEKKTTYPASMVSDGSHSSNVGLSNWFGIDGYSELKDIRLKDDSTKISGCRRLAFQVDEGESGLCGRSFEDAFILANTSLFELKDEKGAELENAVFKRAKKIGSESKANFAIEYAIEKTDWVVPKYICEGLEWLDKDVAVKAEEAQP